MYNIIREAKELGYKYLIICFDGATYFTSEQGTPQNGRLYVKDDLVMYVYGSKPIPIQLLIIDGPYQVIRL